MYVSRRTAVTLLAASALGGSAATAVSALGRDGGNGSHGDGRHQGRLETSLVPSVQADPPLLGATAGAVPWVLRASEAKLRADGRLRVRIRGLLIPSGPGAGTTGPVKTVTVSLYCAGNSTPVGTSDAVPLSSGGDARVDATLTMPAKCQIPALLVHPNGALGVYIASSGLGG
jgi:hypothetical protein